MYSKVYTITCTPGQQEAMLAEYDASVVPAVTASDKHVGHHMVEVGDNKWLLVSNYVSKEAAEAALPMVQELIKPMVEANGMTLEVIGEGEVTRTI